MTKTVAIRKQRGYSVEADLSDLDARPALNKAMTEDQLLTAITEAAEYRGWLVHHDRRSDRALQQGAPGFPDLVLVRRGVVLFWELKRQGGKVTTDQAYWIDDVNYALPGPNGLCQSEHRARIVRPSDLDWALEQLR